MNTFSAAVERSDTLRAAVSQSPDRYRILTGERPTGPLHLGHYFGTISERVRLHDLGVDTFVILADYQVITDRDAIGHVRENVYGAVLFNERYGDVFPEPQALLTSAPEVPGLDGRKMSKSYGNAIALSMTADETAALIRRAPTDSQRLITFDPLHRPGVSALLTTAALCSGRDERHLADDIGDAGAGALKELATDSVNEFLAPHRRRLADFARDPEFVCSVLRDGNRRANVEATRTLDEVRTAMGTVY